MRNFALRKPCQYIKGIMISKKFLLTSNTVHVTTSGSRVVLSVFARAIYGRHGLPM